MNRVRRHLKVEWPQIHAYLSRNTLYLRKAFMNNLNCNYDFFFLICASSRTISPFLIKNKQSLNNFYNWTCRWCKNFELFMVIEINWCEFSNFTLSLIYARKTGIELFIFFVYILFYSCKKRILPLFFLSSANLRQNHKQTWSRFDAHNTFENVVTDTVLSTQT